MHTAWKCARWNAERLIKKSAYIGSPWFGLYFLIAILSTEVTVETYLKEREERILQFHLLEKSFLSFCPFIYLRGRHA